MIWRSQPRIVLLYLLICSFVRAEWAVAVRIRALSTVQTALYRFPASCGPLSVNGSSGRPYGTTQPSTKFRALPVAVVSLVKISQVGFKYLLVFTAINLLLILVFTWSPSMSVATNISGPTCGGSCNRRRCVRH